MVMAVSPEAAERGIRPGMTLPEARARGEVQWAEYDPPGDRRTLEALGRWMMRFSPIVAVDSQLATHHSQLATPAALLVDLTGCQRAFGGLERLVELVAGALGPMGITFRLAVAPTAGAAWAMAYAGMDRRIIVSGEDLSAALAPLPVGSLRLPEDVLAALDHLGIQSIGQLRQLPRDALPSRFGTLPLRRLDEALGHMAEPLVPLAERRRVTAMIDFDGEVESPELVAMAMRELIDRVTAELRRLDCGARRLEVELVRAQGEPWRKSILLSHPSRDPRRLGELVRLGMEEVAFGRVHRAGDHQHTPAGNLPARPADHSGSCERRSAEGPCRSVANRPPSRGPFCGPYTCTAFTAARLSVPIYQRISDEQIQLLGQEQHACQRELDHLVERLRSRLGEAAVSGVELVASHLPERAWRRTVESAISIEGQSKPSPAVQGEAPCCLLARPLEIGVMAAGPEGEPAAFNLGGEQHRVVYAVGPQRIAGQWWEGHNRTRDYWAVEVAGGRRFWVFRVLESGRWFLHGMFQ